MKALPESVTATQDEDPNSPLKILSAVNAFVSEFSSLESFPRMNHRRDKNKKPV
jgi:hypothetical protein